jgi:regulator of protease activity HflC (stomatin/prohibitin superfamily)
MEAKEFTFKGFKMNGFLMIALQLVLLIVAIVAFVLFGETMQTPFILAGLLLLTAQCFIFPGYLQLEPNEAKVMVFFGKYRGTFSTTGFFWMNPFIAQKKLSLRARNLDVEPIKVNDKIGNPILIGLVLVWKLKDTYKAMFEIDAQTMAAQQGVANTKNGQVTIGNAVFHRMTAFENFVKIQSDAALRQVAGEYAYDNNEGEQNNLTLRSGGEEVNDQLEQKLNERLAMAGMEVIEARINYLAYAPEIAAVMLRRQQASAIISAREKIVEGAVSMVKMALQQLADEKVVELDEEKKAAMASNLLVVLCADEAAQPVLNTGTLYQ